MTDEDLEKYRQERPLYEKVARTVAELLQRRCLQLGLPVSVSSRAKAIDSFVKKAIVWNLTYEEVVDKGGVRVVPWYADTKPEILELIRSSFDVVKEKDHSESLATNQFGYRGHHIQIRVPADEGEARPAQPLEIEVQIQTLGENTWATISHDLLYKSDQEVPKEVHRIVNRLSALLELVDEGVSGVREKIGALEAATEAKMLRALERQFFTLVSRGYSKQFSFYVLDALKPFAGDLSTFEERLARFVEQRREKLEHAITDYKDDPRMPYLSQPEGILLLYLLDTERARLEEEWPESLPMDVLRKLEAIWIPT